MRETEQAEFSKSDGDYKILLDFLEAARALLDCLGGILASLLLPPPSPLLRAGTRTAPWNDDSDGDYGDHGHSDETNGGQLPRLSGRHHSFPLPLPVQLNCQP